MQRHLLSISDLSSEEILKILYKALDLKEELKFEARLNYLLGKSCALIFEKPSLRTRVTFELAITQLGGVPIYLTQSDIGLGKREAISDIARNLSRWVNGIIARTYAHKTLLELAQYSTISVINALSDLEHPCQALADFLTIYEKRGKLEGTKLAWVGDGNNVCHSLMLGAALLGMTMKIATPKGYEPNPSILTKAQEYAIRNNAKLIITNDPKEAVKDSEFIYTDTWISMGQEAEVDIRRQIFRPFQVNKELLSYAPHNYYIMHCLPAHRGEEITDEVLDGPHSIVLDQAENRLHVQRAVLFLLLTGRL
ncbi:MAG: ornithine carbamoyltransferase [candidate division WOR-3 bacterium]|nr:ornithine carbamoyltransferase [candidate division WOR-3 bacterium]